MPESDEQWMEQALAAARLATEQNEVPVGALIVCEGKLLASGYNLREQSKNPTAHAELLAITRAAESIGDWRLEGCTLYVTLEPCIMCAGAILMARIPRVVYGATDPKAGAVQSLHQLLTDPRLNHQCNVSGGVLGERCGKILSEFFQAQRRLGKK
jgi:tRNA(adenine34) deaminase